MNSSFRVSWKKGRKWCYPQTEESKREGKKCFSAQSDAARRCVCACVESLKAFKMYIHNMIYVVEVEVEVMGVKVYVS